MISAGEKEIIRLLTATNRYLRRMVEILEEPEGEEPPPAFPPMPETSPRPRVRVTSPERDLGLLDDEDGVEPLTEND